MPPRSRLSVRPSSNRKTEKTHPYSFRESHLFSILDRYSSVDLPLDIHLRNYFRKYKSLGSKDRKFISENVYGLVRWLGLVDYMTKFHNHDHNIKSVNSNVSDWYTRWNTYRNIDVSKLSIDESIPKQIRSSCPSELWDFLVQDYGEEVASDIAITNNTPAPIYVRANRTKTTREKLLESFKSDGYKVERCPYSKDGIKFLKRENFWEMKQFKDGWFEVQDEASQIVSQLVKTSPKQSVLDYCAGSGGKSLAIAPQMRNSGIMYLTDIRSELFPEIRKRMKRAGVSNYQPLPLGHSQLKKQKNKMDWVLTDVPCSGSGTYRRNPDMKWKFSSQMVEELVSKQRQIVDDAMPFVKPKGCLVYTTCSVLKRENEEQIDYFTSKYNLKLIDKFKSFPIPGNMDGFFAAVLTKNGVNSIS
eukprot:gb/GECH01007039.1/.p1 GENE.gb/GECH01007039.1/~~gb/GECH01007039.1/.p1  ORF type:complete len:416 (+),score=89.16 gb/GECH01007039.1/:1-1248(+)